MSLTTLPHIPLEDGPVERIMPDPEDAEGGVELVAYEPKVSPPGAVMNQDTKQLRHLLHIHDDHDPAFVAERARIKAEWRRICCLATKRITAGACVTALACVIVAVGLGAFGR